VYVLVGHNFTPVISYGPLFAAKNTGVDDLDRAQTFNGDIEPCVAVDGAESLSGKRVIGLVSKAGN
jgi:hypothetical protein